MDFLAKYASNYNMSVFLTHNLIDYLNNQQYWHSH